MTAGYRRLGRGAAGAGGGGGGFTQGDIDAAVAAANATAAATAATVAAAATAAQTAAVAAALAGAVTGVVVPVIAGAALAATNMLAAIGPLFGDGAGAGRNRWIPWNLTGYTTAQVYCGGAVSGFAGSQLRGRYSIDGGANFLHLDGASGPFVACDNLGNAVATTFGSVVTLAAGATGEVLLELSSINGNGVVDPTFGNCGFVFR